MSRTVLVVGGGGREHALCLALSTSASIDEIHTTPGNAGTEHYGTNHNVAASDIAGLVNLSKQGFKIFLFFLNRSIFFHI